MTPAGIVASIQAKDNSGVEELYRACCGGTRYYLCRHLGSADLDDRVQDVFLAVWQAIRRHGLRTPESLDSFVRTVARRGISKQIKSRVAARNEQVQLSRDIPTRDLTPEQRVIAREHEAIAVAALLDCPAKDKEILTRFYLMEQTATDIGRIMNLSPTQFRLLKSRAKARFSERGKQLMGRPPMGTSGA